MAVDAEFMGSFCKDFGYDCVDLKRGEVPDRISKAEQIGTALSTPVIHIHEECRVGS